MWLLCCRWVLRFLFPVELFAWLWVVRMLVCDLLFICFGGVVLVVVLVLLWCL